ncbi:MAG: energy-coupling factor ABC transporter permease [Candidatus Firestonebacteria bacterium]|nr:energy-coupling factor ABC transporter permease [Candidatus Firestonebacteria bacterium]
MHIPDGFLDLKTWVSTGIISAVIIGGAVRKVNKAIGAEGDNEKIIPVMGVMGAFVFAAQMFNFPVAGGTSGHFMGGVLAALLLGPLTGLLILTTVLIVQCLIFQDGGLTALGANIFNMGFVGSYLGYYIYKILAIFLPGPKQKMAAIFIAGWFSIVLAAAACALELAFSGTVSLKIALPAMAGVHALIGVGEGLITVVVAGLIAKVRPDLLNLQKV